MTNKVDEVVFYTIEKTIKAYRKFAQRRINESNLDITIDQWLILNYLNSNRDISQSLLAEYTFKDVASVTRMIELLVKKKYLIRSMHADDRRRFILEITPMGKDVIEKVGAIVSDNRTIALNGLSVDAIGQMRNSLNKIIENCK